ncbi:MAG: peptide ABC transporter substrate-binding protein [Clostridia bacterium]|nr:peptide ABC transporter substrate-binding protein [Clostridia bacterium]
MIDTFDITTLDYVFNNKSSNGDYTCNFIEGLLTQDNHGKLIAGMAEKWEANEDASVWTFTIRNNANWVTSEGEVYAQVTAEDFVTGLKHAADSQSETLSLVEDLIVGLKAYCEGSGAWEDVGIKAEGNVLTYTLTQPCGYFDGMTTYSILYPINAEFLESKGDKFGAVEPAGILYNGCYILTSIVSNQEVKFDKNENYYDKDNVFVEHVKVTFTNGEDPAQAFNMFTKGEVTQAAINSSLPDVVEVADRDYKDNQYKSMTTATTYWGAFNFDRQSYALYNNPSIKTTDKTDAQKADTKAAILNKNFRLAVYAAYSTKATQAITKGEDRALDAARNTLVPYTFASKSDGTAYGALVTKYLEELEPAFAGIDLNDGQDAWYSVDKAKAFAEAAKTELGDSVKEWPVHLDYPVLSTNENNKNAALAMKKSIEDAIGDYVKVNLVMFDDKADYYSAFYTVPTGKDNSIDFAFSAGWGPDYGDPLTYINCYNAENGDMLAYSGINLKAEGQSASNVAALEAIGLMDVLDQLKAAATLSGDARVDAFAKIEATLLANGIIRPFTTSGANLLVSKVVPFSAGYGLYGQASYNVVPYFKYMKVQKDVVTTADYNAAKEKWLKGE